MEDPHSTTMKRMARLRSFALVFIGCSVLSIAFTVYNLYDTATRPWDAVSSFDTIDWRLLAPVQPNPEEWPLAIERTDFFARSTGSTRSNRYTVDFTPVRGTDLLRLDIIGRSAERTAAFGLWLTNAFDRDLSGSMTSHGIPLPHSGSSSLIIQAPGPVIPLRLHPGTLIISLLIPLLLLVSGILLFRVSKANNPGA